MPGLFPTCARRRLALAATVVATVTLTRWAPCATAAATTVPDVQAALLACPLSTVDGRAIDPRQLHGRVVVVNFWATWCKPCRKELPALDRLHAELAARGGMVLAISIDRDRAKVERFIAGQRLKLPVVHDGVDGLAARLDLPYLPATYVLDRDGRVAAAVGGGSPADLQALRDAVARLLPTGTPAVADSQGGTP